MKFFEQEEGHYQKRMRIGNFYKKIILNMEVMVIEMKPYQSKNNLMKLKNN